MLSFDLSKNLVDFEISVDEQNSRIGHILLLLRVNILSKTEIRLLKTLETEPKCQLRTNHGDAFSVVFHGHLLI